MSVPSTRLRGPSSGRLAGPAVALALALAGCGGTTAGAPAGAPTAGAPTAGAPTSAPTGTARGGDPTPGAAAQRCPLTALPVPAPPGISSDLSVKPVVPPDPTPPPADVQVADVVVGGGKQADTLDRVQLKYVGALYGTGVEFDSSWATSAQNTIPVTVCTTGTVPGFSIAATGMTVGGRRIVTIPARYGYGAEGRPPTIAPDTPLVFVIDLVGIDAP